MGGDLTWLSVAVFVPGKIVVLLISFTTHETIMLTQLAPEK